jgi:hypothetical protein
MSRDKEVWALLVGALSHGAADESIRKMPINHVQEVGRPEKGSQDRLLAVFLFNEKHPRDAQQVATQDCSDCFEGSASRIFEDAHSVRLYQWLTADWKRELQFIATTFSVTDNHPIKSLFQFGWTV